ncbi:MAG: CopD family protein [Sphingobacteriales bacterium]|nr:CopD family protein [Sphingobacteriales bacterium]
MYLYLKAIHIIFIVTWFAGLFYIVRLFIYNAEANEKSEPERTILQAQFAVMIRRLWYGITWPSALLTIIFGGLVWYKLWLLPSWLLIKLFFVAGLYLYHFSLEKLVRQQLKGVFRYHSQQLRLWNEVATVFLVSIVMLVVVKQDLSVVWSLAGLVLFILLLMSAIRIYKIIRVKQESKKS